MDILGSWIEEKRQEEAEQKAAEMGISVDRARALMDEKRRQEEERYLQDQEAQAAKDAQIRQKQREDEVSRRVAFGSRMHLDCEAHIGHVMSVGGLSSGSAGNGTTRATVWHVVIDSPMAAGRLKRGAGDLLCRTKRTFGQKTMGVTGRGDWEHSVSDWESQAVTCPRCREILERIARRASSR